MPRPRVSVVLRSLSSLFLIILTGCGGGGSSSSFPTGSVQLSVQATGAGTITSSPSGINCGQTCTASFSSGTQVTLTATPAANNYFGGWSGICSGTSTCTVTLTQSASVTASFSASPALSVSMSGTGQGSVSSNPAGINCGTTCTAVFDINTPVTLTATAASNSTFAGWGGACIGTNSVCTMTLSQSQKVSATFSLVQALPTLSVSLAGSGTGTVTSNPGGINCGSTCRANFATGSQVVLSATAGAGSSFTGWSGGGCSGSASTCTVTMSSSQNVTATFSVIQSAPQLSVVVTGSGTVASSPGGISCLPTCNATFPTGTVVTLTATPAQGSYFVGWSGGGGTCNNNSGLSCQLTLTSNQAVSATFTPNPTITVALAGSGSGLVTSSPAGISCQPTCTSSFNFGTAVTLTAAPSKGSSFVGWSGGGGTCNDSNNPSCTLTLTANQNVTATFTAQNLNAINHIVFLAQENRSFDHYFGALREYWAQNGYPDQQFDGLAQFNPGGQPPTNPGCNPSDPPPHHCVFDANNPITSYHLVTQCIETPAPFWDDSHVDWDYFDRVGKKPATLNGFVWNAAQFATFKGYYDLLGIRAMGYYDGGDLNYYYFMASNFATSDRWFSPIMTRTSPNREYLVAATSQGYAYPVGTDQQDSQLLTAPTIFQELQAKGISWKIYVDPTGSKCTGPPYDPACLLTLSYMQNFKWGHTIPTDYPNNIAPVSQYFADLAAGQLPQVAQFEPATDAGFDEHPSDFDTVPNDIQHGANYVSSLINALMQSSSWQDSAFILTFDEFGGLYDHVSPQPAVSPDGIKPVDLRPGDVCMSGNTGPTCDFVYTGFRVPLIVVSPFTQKNYVSHTVADTTAILKLIETRFDLPNLTKRDAAQMDMTEFFDFANPPWLTPPNPPAQITNGACYLDHLP